MVGFGSFTNSLTKGLAMIVRQAIVKIKEMK
jgi:hypothetical protein